jgi:class 3 adenylate cyclase/tetratricopeptide (TPR) repeat protein
MGGGLWVKFYAVIDQVIELLRSRGRLSYRALKIEFELTDDHLEALKEEIIEGQRVAVDEEGRFLVWVGDGESAPTPTTVPQQSQPPASYTPTHLAERILAEQQAMESRGSVDGERKTITALFADLKGSTALIEGLDPEEARAIIDPALQLMMDAVHRYDGYVAQALGDGIFALFGAPIAHEDHPQRALYAALRMQEEMRRYSDQSRLKGGIPLQMRVGINTGEVVVRSIHKDDLHTDYVPVGHSTNLAARMEQMATPGSIVISEYTRKLTEGYFKLKGLGAAEIKGVEEPLNVYEVLGAGPLRTRLQVSARRGPTRFVGRHSEMDQLQRALEQAKTGHGQIVGVMGEPGLGKSRLFHEFKLTSQGGCLVLEALSVSYGKASPYLPLIELLKTYFQIQPQDDERTRQEKIAGKVLILDRSLEETLPYLFSLLGIEDQTSSLQQMDPQIRQGLATWRATGAELDRPYFLALLAEMQGKMGQAEEGLRVVGEALAIVERTEERFYEAELHRLKGELTLQSNVLNPESRVKEAEACFQQALSVARQQSAKSWELRAATSLARLWQQQDKQQEARDLLAPVYNWFTEGFDTADLKDAKALLEELEKATSMITQ